MLAITTWFYVFNEIEQKVFKKASHIKRLPSYGKMVSRKLFVKAVFIGECPNGYQLVTDEVRIDPEYFIVAGPKTLLKDVDRFETEPIDIGKYKRTATHYTRIVPLAPSVDTENLTVKVVIPIKKIGSKKVENTR